MVAHLLVTRNVILFVSLILLVPFLCESERGYGGEAIIFVKAHIFDVIVDDVSYTFAFSVGLDLSSHVQCYCDQWVWLGPAREH